MFDWITGVITSTGYLGIAFLMFIENIFPPIPSELIMPLAGFLAARGDLSPWGVLLAGTAGSVLGAVPWYVAGRRLGPRRVRRFAARHGRWLTLAPHDVDRAEQWFRRHGNTAVLLGRLVPTVRTLISVPAGVACMHPAPFIAFSAVGTLAWTGLLVAAGYLLRSQYEKVEQYMNPVSTGIVVLIVGWYLWRVWRWRA